MVGIDFEYERAIIDRHLDFIERRLREREHEIEMLKNEVKVARLETEQAHEEAIQWAKRADDAEHQLMLAMNFLMGR